MPPPEQNAAHLYLRLVSLNTTNPVGKTDLALFSKELSDPVQLSAAEWSGIDRALRKQSTALALVHQAVKRPSCHFDHDWDNPHPERMALPELATLRASARLLTEESLLMAHRGAVSEAIANERLGFRIAEQAESEPLLLGNLVATAIDAITLSGMRKILILSHGDAAADAAVQAAVLHDVHPRSSHAALATELAFQQTILETTRREGPSAIPHLLQAAAGTDGASKNSPNDFMTALGKKISPRSWNDFIDTNGVYMIRQMRKVIAVDPLNYPSAAAAMAAINADVEHPAKANDHLMASILFVDFTALPRTAAAHANAIRVTLSAAAILNYHAKHGTYPKSLAALGQVPVNAFDGTPLQYSTTNGGFYLAANEPMQQSDKQVGTRFSYP